MEEWFYNVCKEIIPTVFSYFYMNPEIVAGLELIKNIVIYNNWLFKYVYYIINTWSIYIY